MFLSSFVRQVQRLREMAEDEEFLEENGINAQTIGPLKIRRQAILYEGGRQIIHILGEAALRTRVGKVTPATMRSQLDHLAETAQLPGHELGIVPVLRAVPRCASIRVRAVRQRPGGDRNAGRQD